MIRERVNKLSDEQTVLPVPDEIVVSAESHLCQNAPICFKLQSQINKSLRIKYR